MIISPVIVDENGDISIFQSSEIAEIKIEPIDVHNGEYVAYDGEGCGLNIEVLQKIKKGLLGKSKITDRVSIRKPVDSINRSSELREKLCKFIKRAGHVNLDESLSLPELIQESVVLFGYTE